MPDTDTYQPRHSYDDAYVTVGCYHFYPHGHNDTPVHTVGDAYSYELDHPRIANALSDNRRWALERSWPRRATHQHPLPSEASDTAPTPLDTYTSSCGCIWLAEDGKRTVVISRDGGCINRDTAYTHNDRRPS